MAIDSKQYGMLDPAGPQMTADGSPRRVPLGFNPISAVGSALLGGPSSALGQAAGIFGGGGISGGNPSNTTTVNTTTTPWGPQIPYLQQLFQQAQNQFQQGPQQFYPGQTVAGPSADTTAAQGMMEGAVPGAQQSANAVQGALQRNLNPVDVNQNPYLQSAIKAAVQPAIDNFQDAGGTMSQIRSDAGNTGTGFGYNTRSDIAGGLAESRLNRDILNTGATMASDAYKTGVNASTAALGLAPGAIGTAGQPAEMLSGVGNQQEAYSQALIDDAMQRYNFNQNAPWQNLANYQGLITGNYGGTSTGTSTTPVARTNPILAALGGGAAGATIAGPYGAAGGALLGFLASR